MCPKIYVIKKNKRQILKIANNYSQPKAIPHSILFCCNLQARELGICTSPSYWKEFALQHEAVVSGGVLAEGLFHAAAEKGVKVGVEHVAEFD